MLAKANRVTRAADFRMIVRKGRRVSTDSMTVHVVSTGDRPSRFGFIVSKAVGGAVVRNTVRRRMRAACRDLLPSVERGSDVVVRALPASAQASWASLHSELAGALSGARAR